MICAQCTDGIIFSGPEGHTHVYRCHCPAGEKHHQLTFVDAPNPPPPPSPAKQWVSGMDRQLPKEPE